MSTKRKSITSQTSGLKEEEFVKPDGGYGWVILIVAFLISFIVDGCMYSFGIVLVEIKNHFEVKQQIANLVQSLNVGFLFLSGTVLSGLASQFGVRPVVMIGATVFSIMYATCTVVPSIYYMIILFGFIGGVAFACTYNSLFIILVEYFDKKLGVANGMTMAGSGLGAFAFAPFAKFLVTSFGWQTTMLILGALTFLCCGLGLLLRPIDYYKKKAKKSVLELKKVGDEKPIPESERLNQEGGQQQNTDDIPRVHFDETTASAHEKKETASEIFFKIIREVGNFKLLKENKMLLMIVISNFFAFFCYFTPFTFIPIRAKGLNLKNYAWIISIIGICNIPFRVAFGFIADRRVFTAIDMNTVCILIAAVTMYGYYFLTTFVEQAIFAVVFAFAMAGLNCLTTNYVVEIVGSKAFANAFGILSMARGLGSMTGPFLTGIIYEKTGSELYPFLATGISFTIALFFTFVISVNQFIQRRRNKKMMRERNGDEAAS